jgi:pimeloyl-ACP methyl ester carboxylesterase
VRLMLVFFGLLVAVLGSLYAGQRGLIYFPSKLDPARFPEKVRATFGAHATILPPFDAVVIEPTATFPVRATAILFHGNAGAAIDRGYLVPVFSSRGVRLVLAEYPGYGPRRGSPTEHALVEDGEALYAAVLRQYPDVPIVLVGESLGGGVAVQVAIRQETQPPARLVLLTPFLSFAETAARAYPYLPARYLVKDRFDSAGQLPRYRGPIAILVAEKDEVVGPAQGRALAEIARPRGETAYVEIAEAGHNSWTALATDAQWTELLGLSPTPARP